MRNMSILQFGDGAHVLLVASGRKALTVLFNNNVQIIAQGLGWLANGNKTTSMHVF